MEATGWAEAFIIVGPVLRAWDLLGLLCLTGPGAGLHLTATRGEQLLVPAMT